MYGLKCLRDFIWRGRKRNWSDRDSPRSTDKGSNHGNPSMCGKWSKTAPSRLCEGSRPGSSLSRYDKGSLLFTVKISHGSEDCAIVVVGTVFKQLLKSSCRLSFTLRSCTRPDSILFEHIARADLTSDRSSGICNSGATFGRRDTQDLQRLQRWQSRLL